MVGKTTFEVREFKGGWGVFDSAGRLVSRSAEEATAQSYAERVAGLAPPPFSSVVAPVEIPSDVSGVGYDQAGSPTQQGRMTPRGGGR